MRRADITFLFAFDRWATGRVLAALEGVEPATWAATAAIGDRGLGGILIHQLGATQRWRHGLAGSEASPRPERDPLPSIAGLRASWEAEWRAWDTWLGGVDDDALEGRLDGAPLWQYLTHVVNHGTQHRSEAATLLTEAGRSPGDLDLVFFIEASVAAGTPSHQGPA